MTDRNLVGLVHNPLVPEAGDLVRSLAESLKLRGTCWLASAAEIDVDGEALANTGVIITAGGDGTILRVVRVAAPHSVPILGVNLGRVGFMTELSVEQAAEKIPAYLNGTARVEERLMLQASVVSRSGEERRPAVHALNDVVVSRGAVPRLLDLEIMVDGVPLPTYRADGVIVATATGSTGYSLSAGGPILYPEAKVVLIQPLAAHMSLQSGIIVPDASVVQIGVRSGPEAVFSLDGLTDAVLGEDEVVVIERSPHVARFLRADTAAAFYSTVTRRLGVHGLSSPTS